MASDKEIIRTGKDTSYVIEENDEGKQEFLQLIKSPTYDDNGNVSGIIAIINDVTEAMSDDTKTATFFDAVTEQTISDDDTENTASAINEFTDEDVNTEEITEIQQQDYGDNSEEASDNPDTQEISTEQSLPAMNVSEPEYYTIVYGDTLSSIAYAKYGSIEFAENIAKANNLDEVDKIYEGQKIVLPIIE